MDGSVSVVTWYSQEYRGGIRNVGIHGVYADHERACDEAARMNRRSPDFYEAVSYMVIPNAPREGRETA